MKAAHVRSLSQLDGLVKKVGIRLKSLPPKSSHRTDIVPPRPQTDDDVFAEAMLGVTPTVWRHETLPSTAPPPAISRTDEGMTDLRLMQAAIDPNASVPVLDHPEYIEGWVGVAGKRFLPNLRSGMYSIQGHIDLHGLSRLEAQGAVEEFVFDMSRFRSCCVKIIHGRGLNSPNDKAILKDNLQRWLCMRRMSRLVVAYASAPVNDGGVGAVYVLLRPRLSKQS